MEKSAPKNKKKNIQTHGHPFVSKYRAHNTGNHTKYYVKSAKQLLFLSQLSLSNFITHFCVFCARSFLRLLNDGHKQTALPVSYCNFVSRKMHTTNDTNIYSCLCVCIVEIVRSEVSSFEYNEQLFNTATRSIRQLIRIQLVVLYYNV